MAPRWGQGADRDNAERLIHRTWWGRRRPDRCQAVSLRSGTVGRAASRSSITWCDPGRAVVWAPLASGRNWMVLLAYRANRAPDVEQGVLRERQRCMFEWRAVSRWW